MVKQMRSFETPPLYWTVIRFHTWDMRLVATDRGVCWAGLQDDSNGEWTAWTAKHFPRSPLIQADARLKPYATQLVEYFQGKRSIFTIPLDLRGTPFQLSVWNALRDIPFSATRSYSEIAQRIGRPSTVRAVGAAIGANPVLILVPCHRVIGKDGSLTGFRAGLDLKRRLLQLEWEHSSHCGYVGTNRQNTRNSSFMNEALQTSSKSRFYW